MLHWFDGTIKSIIEQHKQDPRNDARTTYNLALKEMDDHFKDNQNSIALSLVTISNGRQLNSGDLQGHENLHSALGRFLLSASNANSMTEFQCQESHITNPSSNLAWVTLPMISSVATKKSFALTEKVLVKTILWQKLATGPPLP